jgi:hypothetical protein
MYMTQSSKRKKAQLSMYTCVLNSMHYYTEHAAAGRVKQCRNDIAVRDVTGCNSTLPLLQATLLESSTTTN